MAQVHCYKKLLLKFVSAFFYKKREIDLRRSSSLDFK
jgi:hypothetical protein